MNQNRVKQAENVNGALKAIAPQPPTAQVNRRKASGEFVLAAQLNQARETIAALLGQIADQEQTIATLQQRLASIELQNVQNENEKLRAQHGLTVGLKLEKDQNGEWWILEEVQPSSNSN